MTATEDVHGLMDPTLIKTINRIQDAFTTVGIQTPIDLPQITVVGSQSSGKSSVLENIVGRDFLPRGTGIVTRRPLILQLINRKDANESDDQSNQPADFEEWGEFLHLPGQKFFDFNKIREEIIRETDAKTGKNVGISALPINLRIFSPNVFTLTLVDLPGLTKVPVGDQPKDIEKQIRDMILQFISKPNAIILSVTAGNTDLANSDGLKLAREVDPEGVRTLGVLTKIDLMDPGTDVVDVLKNKVIPLRMGYIPVINRGQRDIERSKSIRAALEYERDFFEQHPSYKSKASFCGTPYLAKKLNVLLMHHIRTLLPEIKAHIAAALTKYQSELANLGDPILDNNSNVILNIITEFCNDFRTSLDGKSDTLSSNELSGGARISFVYHELFANGIKAIDPFDQVKDLDIRTILYNSSGASPALFVGTAAFEVIVKQQIKRLEEPSLKCISLIYDELIRILSQLLNKPLFKRYPALLEEMHRVVVAFFKKSITPTNKLVIDIIAAESCYVNTGHPDFITGHKAMALVNEKYNSNKAQPLDPKTGKPLNNQQQHLAQSAEIENNGFFGSFFASKNRKKLAAMEAPPPTLKASGVLSEREQIETEVIKILINSYFNIVKRTVIDMIPKAIMLQLVTFARDNLQRELLENLYKSDMIDDLLKESEITKQKRKDCQRMVESLTKAQDIVSQT